MSFGSAHHRRNYTHAHELENMLRQPDAQRMWHRPFKVVMDMDCPDGGGYSVLGDIYFIDQAIVEAVRSGKIKVPGLDANQVIECILRHERIEKTLLDADNNIAFYPGAHEYATCGEHELVIHYGGKPYQYEDQLEPVLLICERKPLVRVHPQLDCAPYVDDPDRTDLKIIKKLRKAGVLDARKLGRHDVNYRPGDKTGKCWACKHYQQVDEIRGTCEGVEGLVLGRMLCDHYAKRPAMVQPASGAAPIQPTKQEAPATQAPSLPPEQQPAAHSPQPPPAAPTPPEQPPPGPAAPAAPVPQPPPEPTPAVAPMPAAAQGALAATLGAPGGALPPAAQPAMPPPTAAPVPPTQDSGGAIEKMAEAIKDLAEAVQSRPIQVNVSIPRSKSKKISTKRGPDGNLVAHVTEDDDEEQ